MKFQLGDFIDWNEDMKEGGSKMADEGGDMLETRRRSVRIWALEEEKKKKKTTTTTTTVGDKQQKASVTNSNPLLTAGNETVSVAAFKTNSIAGVPHFQHTQVQEDQHKEQQHARPPTFKQYDRRRVKRKRLEDVVVSSPAYFSPAQEGENDPKHGSTSIRNDHRASSSSLQRLPEKRVLEFVIDILQRRDTYEIFAQPVDPEEVEGYYRIIKEPMDFGTMRAKLQEGMYTSLEQFEHDVFLISNNAMHFNSSTTVFYREARSIQELAQRVFHALKTDPENFVLEFSLTKKRPGRKPQGEAAGPSTKRARYGKVNIGAAPRRNTKTERLFDLNSHFEQRQNKIPSGSGTGFGTERRQTYKPPRENESIFSSQYDLPKPLIHIIDGELGYKESLMEFVKDLGPTAQMVANRKLEKYRQIEASNSQFQAQAPSTSSTPSWLVPPPSLTLAPNYLDGVNNGEIPQSILHNLPGDYLDDANKRLDGHGDVFKGENAQTSCGINTHDAAYKGKMVCTDSRMDMDNTFFSGMVPSSDIMGTSGDLRRVNPHFSTIKAVKIASPEVAASNTRGNIDIFGSSKGKQICTDESMNLLHGNDRYDTTHQNQYGEMWYGSHFPLSGIENTNTPLGDGITNTCDKYQTIDMMAEFNQPRNQMQPDELANVLHSRLQELMSGNSSVLTSQAPKVSVQDTTFLNRLGSQEEGRVNREQAAQSLEWPRSTTPQTSRGFPSVQMQLNKNRLVGRSTILRERTPHLRASQLVAAQKMAVLHAMSFYDKATPESHQAEDSQRQSSSDNSKQLDLALQL